MKTYRSALSLLLVSAVMIVAACGKAEDPQEEDTGGQPSTPQFLSGCYVQEILAPDFDPMYTFNYESGSGGRLELFREYNETTGQVDKTFLFLFDVFSPTQELDSVLRYDGDMSQADYYSDLTVFHYTWVEDEPYMDSASVFTYNLDDPEEPIRKGTIHYNYDGDGLLTS